MLKTGDKAPDFTLTGIDPKGEEKTYTLKELLSLGKELIVYFYPRDNTPGCTTEACDFRDHMMTLNKTIIGISKDSIASHTKFMNKHELNFALLSDPDTKVMQDYGAWGEKNMYGKKSMGTIRSTFVIGTDGLIKSAFYKVKVKGHVEELAK